MGYYINVILYYGFMDLGFILLYYIMGLGFKF
jgi:hypothetical protein